MTRGWTRLLLLPPYVAISSIGGLLIGFLQGIERNLELAWTTNIIPDIVFVSGSLWCGVYGYRCGFASRSKRGFFWAIARTGGLALATYWLSALVFGAVFSVENLIVGAVIMQVALYVWPVALYGAPGLLFATLAPPILGRHDARVAARREAEAEAAFADDFYSRA